jgi:hypothetical protein
MGKALKFDRDKAHRAVVHPAFVDLADVLAEAIAGNDPRQPIKITVTGATTTTVNLSSENLAEVIEILRLTIGED